jgi:hypothetical protein
MARSYTARLLPARPRRRYTWDTAPRGTPPATTHRRPRTTQTRSDDMAIGVGTLILIIILILILT